MRPVQADETYAGGKAKNAPLRDRKRRIADRGGVDKAIFVGVLDRPTGQLVAGPVHDTTSRTLAGDMVGKRLRYDDLVAVGPVGTGAVPDRSEPWQAA